MCRDSLKIEDHRVPTRPKDLGLCFCPVPLTLGFVNYTCGPARVDPQEIIIKARDAEDKIEADHHNVHGLLISFFESSSGSLPTVELLQWHPLPV